MRTLHVLLLIFVAFASLPPRSSAQQVQAGPVAFEFATVQQGRDALGKRDAFIEQMSVTDRQVRMGAAEDPGEAKLLEFVSREVIAWDDESRSQFTDAIKSLDQPLSQFPLPPLETVLLIRTTGKEESGAAYTRGTVVVLPVGHRAPKDKLIAHELFHVISRNFPELRDKLYARIGFRRSGRIDLPGELGPRKLTNPDAPAIEHVIDVKLSEGQSVTVTPVLYASRPYDPEANMTIFSNMEAKLMEVMPIVGKQFAARMEGGKPIMHELATPDYLRQVGRNSRSIFHPEEILADNFATLVVGSGLRIDSWVQDAIEEEFKSFVETP